MTQKTKSLAARQSSMVRNPWSWSYFNGYKNPEIAKQLSYYQWEPYRRQLSIVEKVPLEKRPANFELFFGKVPDTWQSGPIKLGEYEHSLIKQFYSIAEAVKYCHQYFGVDTALYYYSFPGLDYISEIGNTAGSLRVMPYRTYLFPSCVITIREIADYLNIQERSIYKTSPCD